MKKGKGAAENKAISLKRVGACAVVSGDWPNPKAANGGEEMHGCMFDHDHTENRGRDCVFHN